MTAESVTYRQRAQAERAAAYATDLPLRREQHLRSAEAWDAMAQKIELTAEKALVNAKAKAQGEE